jgi:probable HAF family extracellular repeat protein
MTNLVLTLGEQSSWASTIGKHEQVVGWSDASGGFQQAFLWEGGRMVDVGTLGGITSQAVDVDHQGPVVGGQVARRIALAPSASGGFRAFFWEPPKTILLGTLGGQSSWANAINKHGQVVGLSDAGGGIEHAFLWDSGSMHDLGTLGGKRSEASDINDQGQIVGVSEGSTKGSWWTGQPLSRAFLWQNGQMNELGALPGAPSSLASGINNLGQIVGSSPSEEGGNFRAFLWQDGEMSNLGTSKAVANAINDSGQIVGVDYQVGGPHAVRWTKRMRLLDSDSIPWGGMKMRKWW